MKCVQKGLSRLLLILATAALSMLPNASWAGIVVGGDVSPFDYTTWTSNTDLYVGQTTTGTVDISGSSAGVQVCQIGLNASAAGTVTVSNAGSLNTGGEGVETMLVGGSGSGTLDILSGGTVSTSPNGVMIANEAGSTGQVTIDGAGSTLTGGEFPAVLVVGNNGTATLSLSNGGYVDWYGYLAVNPTSTVNVDGSGTILRVVNDMTVGGTAAGGTAMINITNGGNVSSNLFKLNEGTANFVSSETQTSTLNTVLLYADDLTKFTGAGLIQTNGIISNENLTFDGVGTTSLSFGTAGTINVDLSTSGSWRQLGIGYNGGSALVTVQNGAVIQPTSVGVGYDDGSAGTLSVDGGTVQSNYLNLGSGGAGTSSLVEIKNGGTVVSSYNSSGYAYIGNSSGSVGTLNVDGAGSMLSEANIYVGYSGSGALNITNGAIATAGTSTTSYGYGKTYIGYQGTNTGLVSMDNGTLATKSLYTRGASQFSGTGMIYTRGLVADMDLTFDSTDGLTKSFALGATSVTMNLDMTSSTNGDLGAGYYGNGSLSITDITVGSSGGYVGYGSGSAGTVTIGNSGYWKNSSTAYYGREGNAVIDVQAGGTLSNSTAYVGYSDGSSATVTVGGEGAVWKSSTANIGYNGTGIVTINSGGSMSATSDLRVAGSDGAVGTLNINSGGSVSVSSATHTNYALYGEGLATGTINFNGGSLVTKNLFTTDAGITGTGVISTKGLVSNSNLTFDSAGSTTVTFGTGVLTTVDMSSTSNSGMLGIGYSDTGAAVLAIQNGANVYAGNSYVGYQAGSAGTATVDAYGDTGSKWKTSSLYVGYYGTGKLYIYNGGSVTSSSTYIGSGSSGAGLMEVSGSGSTWVGSSSLYVGSNGIGTLKVNNGGVVSGTGSWGSLYIGYQSGSTGLLRLQSGGSLSWAANTYVDDSGANVGSIEFSGGSMSTVGLVSATSQITGSGTLATRGLVSDRSLVFDNTAVASFNWDSVATTVDLSATSGNGDLGVGMAGNSASLTVQNGAVIYSGNGYVGYSVNTAGSAIVDGAGTQWNLSSLYVGGYRTNTTGQLAITNGAAVVSSSNVNIGSQGAGTATISDSSLSAAYGITVGQSANGILTVTNSTITTAGLSVAPVSMITGTVDGSGAVYLDNAVLQANTSRNNSFQPWLADSYAGNFYVQSGGVTIDTNGYDNLATAALQAGTGNGGLTKIGDATLTLTGANTYTGLTTVQAGVLVLGESAQNVVLNEGGADIQSGKMLFDYSSTAPDVATLLSASYSGGSTAWTTGQFLSTTANASHGLGWADNGMNQITVMYTLYGDSNLDGSVNGTDLNAVLSYYNQSSQVWACGDFNYDGSVNGTDLNTVLSNYNQSLSASTAAVPEPSTLLLMVLGLIGLLVWRRK